MKKKVIWTAVLLFFGSAAVAGVWQSSKGAGVFFALVLLLALAAVWGIFKKLRRGPASPAAPAAQNAVRQDPDEVDYPFTNCGIARATAPADYIVLDTETTGFSPRDDKVIEVAALKLRGGQVTRFHTLVNPGRRIPNSAKEIHGLTDADVAAAPDFSQVAPALLSFLDPDLPIVGHNISYDLRMLWWAFHDAGGDIGPRVFIDTYKLAKKAFPGRDSYALASLIHDFHLIDGEQQHRAESDVDATLALYRLCCEKLALKK